MDPAFSKTLLGGKVALRLLRVTQDWAKAQGARELHIHATAGLSAKQTDRFFQKTWLHHYWWELWGGVVNRSIRKKREKTNENLFVRFDEPKIHIYIATGAGLFIMLSPFFVSALAYYGGQTVEAGGFVVQMKTYFPNTPAIVDYHNLRGNAVFASKYLLFDYYMGLTHIYSVILPCAIFAISDVIFGKKLLITNLGEILKRLAMASVVSILGFYFAFIDTSPPSIDGIFSRKNPDYKSMFIYSSAVSVMNFVLFFWLLFLIKLVNDRILSWIGTKPNRFKSF